MFEQREKTVSKNVEFIISERPSESTILNMCNFLVTHAAKRSGFVVAGSARLREKDEAHKREAVVWSEYIVETPK